MGSYSRGQSMDSIYRIKAFSGKNTLACSPCLQTSPSSHDIIWLLQQPSLMSTAVDDYHLHLRARPREVKTCPNYAASESWELASGLSAPLSFVSSCSRGKQHLEVIQYFFLFQV